MSSVSIRAPASGDAATRCPATADSDQPDRRHFAGIDSATDAAEVSSPLTCKNANLGWYAGNACEAFASNLGDGIKLSSLIEVAGVRDRVQRLWLAGTDEADADGLTDFYDLQAMVARDMFVAGGCFVRLRPRRAEDGLLIPLQLQLLQSEKRATKTRARTNRSAPAQLSRQVEAREDKRPQLSDLRESGSIEQDADVVRLVFLEEYYHERTEPAQSNPRYADWQAKMSEFHGRAEVVIGKQRHGPIGHV